MDVPEGLRQLIEVASYLTLASNRLQDWQVRRWRPRRPRCHSRTRTSRRWPPALPVCGVVAAAQCPAAACRTGACFCPASCLCDCLLPISTVDPEMGGQVRWRDCRLGHVLGCLILLGWLLLLGQLTLLGRLIADILGRLIADILGRLIPGILLLIPAFLVDVAKGFRIVEHVECPCRWVCRCRRT